MIAPAGEHRPLIVCTRIFRTFRALNLNAVVFQVANPVFAHEATIDNDDTLDTGVVDEFGAHHAGLARDDEPRVVGWHAVGSSVADEVHLSVVASDLDARPGLDVHRVSEAFISSTQPTTASWATVVAVHQHHVALGVNQQGSKGSSGAVRGFSQRQALLDSNLQVLVLHALTALHEPA